MKKKIVALLIVLMLLAVAHFVPIYQRLGYLDSGFGNLCVGYSLPNAYSKRVILQGLKAPKGFKADPLAKYGNMVSGGNAAKGTIVTGDNCSEPVRIRYYLL